MRVERFMKKPVQQTLKASGEVETVKERGGEVVLKKMEELGRRLEKLVSKMRVWFCKSAKSS